jgi:hypothetical protein
MQYEVKRLFSETGVHCDWQVYTDESGLSFPVRPIATLVFDSWIPPTVQVDDIRCPGKIQPEAGGSRTE